ncbi:MAG: UDP-2,3-diacylglucosamine diphosphatase LpxI [Thermodesulfovibrionia bacterium]
MPIDRWTQINKRLGILSGIGELPNVIAVEAKKKGYSITAIIPSPLENATLEEMADESYRINIGNLSDLISLLDRSQIGSIVMAGGFPKTLLYKRDLSIPGGRRLTLDAMAIGLLKSLNDLSDDSIMDAVVEEIEKRGIKVHGITSFTKDLMTDEGILTHREPSESEWMDIRFGWRIVKGIGRLGIGQTVVVKDRAVMAVEAIEGTDEAIKRGGMLAGGGAVVVKSSRPNQDMRYDIPVVGIETLRVMNDVGAHVLALEAKKGIILEKESFIKMANEMGISVVGVSWRRK